MEFYKKMFFHFKFAVCFRFATPILFIREIPHKHHKLIMLSNITEILYIYNVFTRDNKQLYFIFDHVF